MFVRINLALNIEKNVNVYNGCLNADKFTINIAVRVRSRLLDSDII